MTFLSRAALAALILAPLAACGPSEPEQVGPPEPLNRAADAPPLKAPPPMIMRQPRYRCDDGGALYISVMSDESFVTIRDRIEDVPVRLERNPETQDYEGEGRTLSGVGDTIRYGSAQRPGQECRAAAE